MRAFALMRQAKGATTLLLGADHTYGLSPGVLAVWLLVLTRGRRGLCSGVLFSGLITNMSRRVLRLGPITPSLSEQPPWQTGVARRLCS